MTVSDETFATTVLTEPNKRAAVANTEKNFFK